MSPYVAFGLTGPQRLFANVIKDFDMGRSTWIICMDPKGHCIDPYKREGKGQSKASVTIAVERDWKMLHWLLTLKMEGGAVSQGVQAPSRSWKRKRTSFSPIISRRNAVLMICFERLTARIVI